MTFLEAVEMALKQMGHPMKPDDMVAMAIQMLGWVGWGKRLRPL